MTVIFTFFGTFVFIVSAFTVGFKAAFKRLAVFAIAGVIIDSFIIGIALLVSLATNLN